MNSMTPKVETVTETSGHTGLATAYVGHAADGIADSRANSGADDTHLVGRSYSAADVTAVICCYTMARWNELCLAIDSVTLNTTDPPGHVIVVVDHNDELQACVEGRLATNSSQMPNVTVLANGEAQGLSGARNTALAAAESAIVAFLDDDAVAPMDWSRRLAGAFVDNVVVVGGGATPVWSAKEAPDWFPDEFGWVVGCSYVGMPSQPAYVRNVIGCNMAMLREAALRNGGFAGALGRVGADTAGCEETELCIRMSEANGEAAAQSVRFLPDLRVRHHVTHERETIGYFWRRCVGEGRSKAMVASRVGASQATSSERSHLTKVLPAGCLREAKRALRGDFSGAKRMTMIVVGTVGAAVGFLRVRVAATIGGLLGHRE